MITPEQRELRRKHLGASDIPAVLGLDPYRSPADVWLMKTGQVDDPDESSEAIELGNDFEPVGVKRLAKRIGRIALEAPSAVAENGVMLAHADCLLMPPPDVRGWQINSAFALVADGALPGEIKWRNDSADWGEDGSDQVPVAVTAQVYAQAICLKVALAYVGAFFPKYRGVDFRHYALNIKPELAREIEDRACAWWEAHVVKGIMPEGASPSLELVKRIERREGLVKDVRAERVMALVRARKAATDADKAKDRAEADLRAEMLGASCGRCDGYEVIDQVIDKAAEKLPRPALRYRVLRVKEVVL